MKSLFALTIFVACIQGVLADPMHKLTCKGATTKYELTLLPGNIVKYKQITKSNVYLRGTARPSQGVTCAKDYSCYSGGLIPASDDPEIGLPRNTYKFSVKLPTLFLNGLHNGKVTTVVGSKSEIAQCSDGVSETE